MRKHQSKSARFSPCFPSIPVLYGRWILKLIFSCCRLTPVAASLSRALDQDTVLSGYNVPENVSPVLSLFYLTSASLHHVSFPLIVSDIRIYGNVQHVTLRKVL